MISVVARLTETITLQGVTKEVESGVVTASRGYPQGGGEDIVTLSICSPDGSDATATFSTDEFEQFIRVLGFLT